jgi:hypothetical protein
VQTDRGADPDRLQPSRVGMGVAARPISLTRSQKG